MKTRSPLRLFLVYTATFAIALVVAWIILVQLIGSVQEGEWILLLLPPLGGMAVFHGLFPLVSRLRLGLEFLAVGGGLVYGLSVLLAGLVWVGLITPTAALLMWLVGVFGPGWWILSAWAERIGYFE